MKTLADKLHIDLCRANSFVSDAYAMRNVLRKAQKFTLDNESSAKVSDFSIAIAKDLESARAIAIPPYPLTWVELDNNARHTRAQELGIKKVGVANKITMEDINPFTAYDSSRPVPRIGWLIERHHNQHTAFKMTFVGEVDAKVNAGCVFVTPWAWAWDIEGNECPWSILSYSIPPDKVSHYSFGVHPSVSVAKSWIVNSYGSYKPFLKDIEVLQEFAGELRNCWGLLVALGSLPTIDHAVIRIENPNDTPVEPIKIKDKIVQPFVLRNVTLRIPRLRNINKVVQRCLEGVRKRRHEVRGHFRHYRNAEGVVVRKVWIQEHERGDIALGRVEHRYRVIAR